MSRQLTKILGPSSVKTMEGIGGASVRTHVGSKTLELDSAIQMIFDRKRAAVELGYKIFAGQLMSRKTSDWGIRLFAVSSETPELKIADIMNVGILSEPGANSVAAIESDIREHPDGLFAKMVKSGRLTVQQLADPSPKRARAKSRRFFSKVFSKLPYEIYYADQKGCRTTFTEKVSAQDADWLQEKIIKFNPEAMDLIKEGTLSADILERQEMRLWWD